MRLIDADEFILSLNNYIDKPMTAGLCTTLITLFPTAYDIDKVVEELEEKLSEKKYQHEDEDYFVGICDAIEIVKQGLKEQK